MLAFESLRSIILSIPKDLIGIFLVLNLCACLGVFVSRRWSSGATVRAPSPDLEKPALGVRGKVVRPPGGEYMDPAILRNQTDSLFFGIEWTPSDFKRPTATPYTDWNVHSTKPLPYRPFRYGP